VLLILLMWDVGSALYGRFVTRGRRTGCYSSGLQLRWWRYQRETEWEKFGVV
jgi:hypothetical protein